MGKHRLQIFEIEEEHTVVIGNLEDKAQHPALDLIQVQEPAEKKWPEL